MPKNIQFGHLPTKDELLDSAKITKAHIEDAKRVSAERAPKFIPAFYATELDPDADPGPISDAG